MKIRLIRFSLVALSIVLVLASCSEYQKTLKSNNYDVKYDMAVKYYDKKDYFRASTLLEELLPISRATQKAEKIFYYYAYTQYYLGEYQMAAYHFDNFVRTYPKSTYTEECNYMVAYCYYLDSPNYSLDQSNTAKAINEIQLFINRYPSSSRVKECNEIMDKLRQKLETKSFENAELYFNMEEYKSSIFAFRNMLKDFPDTQYREKSMFYILKSSYLLGINSVEEKKSERLKAAVEAYNAYVDAFSNGGKYLKEAQIIFENSVKQIDKLKKNNS
jgi:outer membrane protein assembly factor BamD